MSQHAYSGTEMGKHHHSVFYRYRPGYQDKKLRLSCPRMDCSSIGTPHLPWLSGSESNKAGLKPSAIQGQVMAHKEDAGSVNTRGCFKGLGTSGCQVLLHAFQ